MPREDPRAPKFGQESLFDAGGGAELAAPKIVGQVTRGRHSEAVDRSIVAAYKRGIIEDVDEAAVTLLRAVGSNADLAEARRDLYTLSKLLPGANELLDRLHMTPDSRVTETDEALAELVDKMNQAHAEVDEDDDAQIHHPEV